MTWNRAQRLKLRVGDLDLYGGRHRGLRIEVSDLGPLGWDSRGHGQRTPRLGGRDPPGGVQAVGALRAGQMSETLSIREGQANISSKGPDGSRPVG